jgi:hypothetical protein
MDKFKLSYGYFMSTMNNDLLTTYLIQISTGDLFLVCDFSRGSDEMSRGVALFPQIVTANCSEKKN